MTIIPFLLLLAACVRSAWVREEQPVPQSEAPDETPSRVAGLDDVRLLGNGLLQLGHSLREFVQKTKGQINDILRRLNVFDRSFYQLSALAGEIKEGEEELRRTTVVLMANSEEIKGQSVEMSSRVDSMLQEKSHLRDKLDVLEERLSGLSPGLTSEQAAEINGLRDMMEAQERSITELLRAVREQSEQLNRQRVKINSLEEKLTANTLTQETIGGNPEVFNREAPTVTPHLTSSSTSTDTMMNLPSDCSELFNRGERVSGVYAIGPGGSEPFMAFCDMKKDHGATVIQRRKDGSVNFDQTWENYENGFGDFQGEFWLGLKKIHSLAAHGNSVLQIHLEDWKRGSHFYEYGFDLNGPDRNYTIHLTHLSGESPDPMRNHTGMVFSTKERDNDKHPDSSCAQNHTGGWWFNACRGANLNGRYLQIRPNGRPERRRGIQWRPGQKAAFSQISVHPVASTGITSSTSVIL